MDFIVDYYNAFTVGFSILVWSLNSLAQLCVDNGFDSRGILRFFHDTNGTRGEYLHGTQ